VRELIVEAEAAADAAAETMERARARALDPMTPSSDAVAARSEAEDAAFRQARLRAALTRLRSRINELKAQAVDAERRERFEQVKAERDALAAELKREYPALAAKLVDLLTRLSASDAEVQIVNSQLPSGASPLRGAELVARDLESFERGFEFVPRLTARVALPAFSFSTLEPYVWPPAQSAPPRAA
jgi:hypothetical protein